MSVLSKPEILKHLKAGNIVIDPFEEKNLSNTSYDVRLGKFFFRQSTMKHTQTLNPFYHKSVKKMYSKVEKAIPVKEVRSKTNPFYNFFERDLIIIIAPGETILTHTIEFVGGRNGTKKLPAVTTEMRARSSIGRIGIGVCKCAGWGDIGYVNRWTMEITNWSNAPIPLPVGLRVAQIIFHSTQKVKKEDLYPQNGKYQKNSSIKILKKNWKPELMLPQLSLDRDLGQFKKYTK